MFFACNETPHRGLLPVLPSIRVYFKNVPKSRKCMIIVSIENAKLKLLKVTIMRYAIVLSFFIQKFTLETWGPLDILHKVCSNSQI